MGIVCSMEDFDSIDRLRQIFAWMSGATGDLDVKGFVGCPLGNDNTRLKVTFLR